MTSGQWRWFEIPPWTRFDGGVKKVTAVLFMVALSLSASLRAQTPLPSLSVFDSTTSFTAIQGVGGGILTDVAGDQQTGQADSDFVGDATNWGFSMRLGSFGGADALAFRVRLNSYNSNLSNFNIRLGIDSNVDGLIDLYFGVTSKGANISFFESTGGASANVSPSTTSMTQLANSFNVATTASNFSYVQAANLFTGGSSNSDDALATFIVTFNQLNSALNSFGAASLTPFEAYRYVAVSSTQTSTVNQDAYGYGSLSTSGALRFDEVYAPIVITPVPEPETWISSGALILSAIGMWFRRRRRRAAAAA
jgi:hypothetical protein